MLDLDVAPRWMIDRVAEAEPLDPGVFRELIESASRAPNDPPQYDTPEAPPATTAIVDRIGDALRRLEHRLSGVPVVSGPAAWADSAEVTPLTGLDRRVFPRRGAHGPVTIARGLTTLVALAGATGFASGFDQATAPIQPTGGASGEHDTPPPRLQHHQELSRRLDDHGLSGELLDLSRNGLSCLTIHPLERDETIGVRLCHPEHRVPLDTTAEVVRATNLGDGRWKVVARFTRPLSFDDTYELCDHSAITFTA